MNDVAEGLPKTSKRKFAHLRNTRTVCKKYYVHPLILSLYESGKLEKNIEELDEIEKDDGKARLSHEEQIVMKILETN